MKNILYPVTLLFIAVLFMSFRSDSDPEKSNSTWLLGSIPLVEDISTSEEKTFSQLFAVKSNNKNLGFEVYSSEGEKIPGNIYRYHRDGIITYEIGRGLAEGLYIIKMSSNETDQYFKLIRFGY